MGFNSGFKGLRRLKIWGSWSHTRMDSFFTQLWCWLLLYPFITCSC